MQPALIEAYHERMSGNASAGCVTQSGGEISTGNGTERFAGSKPEQRAGRQAFTKGVERRMMRVTRTQHAAVERFAIDEHAPPLAMTPKLELGDWTRGLVTGKPSEGVGETLRAVSTVGASQPSIQPSSVFPAQPQRSWPARKLGRVVDHQP